MNDLLEKLKRYQEKLLQFWPWMLMAGLMGALCLGLFSMSQMVFFKATTTFHPEGDSGAPQLDFSNPAALLTASLSGGGSLANNQVIGVLQSRRISEAVTGDTIAWEGKKQLVADLILYTPPSTSKLFETINQWFEKEPEPMPVDKKIIITGKQLRESLEIETDDNGFILLHMQFAHPKLVKLISTLYIDKLKEYYHRQKTAKAQRNLTFFTHRGDSVKAELDRVNLAIASYYDRNKYATQLTRSIFVKEQEIKQELLGKMYLELEISREGALAQLQQDTPVIQVLDFPDPPYPSTRPKVLMYTFIGIFLFAGFAFLVITRKLWIADLQELISNSMQQDSSQVPGSPLPQAPPQESV